MLNAFEAKGLYSGDLSIFSFFYFFKYFD